MATDLPSSVDLICEAGSEYGSPWHAIDDLEPPCTVTYGRDDLTLHLRMLGGATNLQAIRSSGQDQEEACEKLHVGSVSMHELQLADVYVYVRSYGLLRNIMHTARATATARARTYVYVGGRPAPEGFT